MWTGTNAILVLLHKPLAMDLLGQALDDGERNGWLPSIACDEPR
jgi:hypothetical protein